MYPWKQFSTSEGEMKTFHDKWILKEFMITKPMLKKVVKWILCTEEEDENNYISMGRINHSRWKINKQELGKKQSHIIKTTKWQVSLHTFQ
jgi:hypothetical protein